MEFYGGALGVSQSGLSGTGGGSSIDHLQHVIGKHFNSWLAACGLHSPTFGD